MRATTLYQPWASLIVDGIKIIETRDWSPHVAAIGDLLAIHAGKYVVKQLDESLYHAIVSLYGFDWQNNIPYGSVLGHATLKNVVQVKRNDDEFAYYNFSEKVPIDIYGDFNVGRYLWFLDDIVKYENPIPAKGHFKIWSWNYNG